MKKAIVFILILFFLMYSVIQSRRVEDRWLDEFPVKTIDSEQEKELLGALQEVLEKLQHRRLSTWDKKFSRVPRCAIGDYCSVKKGARFGKLCDCPQEASCNFFFLKCL
ncbi:cocaine- and amphetamine-regulated transcript protein-like [Erpetoichthys calabaricus]|uniref:Cocaine- and amphetamine-regulated transcript protein n=1 Tax=Erpetoichthys calabaricus TaxID=27687 RepID=A0A8C4X4L1_ERPCA|nr:cocaine- and amphetamine-regulated transcript protein-like [Erpetoichthys calabaricus]